MVHVSSRSARRRCAPLLLAAALAAGCSGSGGGDDGGGTPPPADPCAPAALTGALGCEFFPTVTATVLGGAFPFGVAVVNPGAEAATVRIEGGALGAALEFVVAAGGSEQRALPWVAALKGCINMNDVGCGFIAPGSVLAAGGAYRVTSTRPVAVVQFSPMVGEAGPERPTTTADATAVPPVHALGTRHFAASWPSTMGYPGETLPGFVAITAVADGTEVTVTSTAAVPERDLPAFAAGAPRTVTLNRGDVLQLLADAPEISGGSGDLSGTLVESSAPVLVIGGHACAMVPATAGWCDHLEEAIPPVSALGTAYVLVPPRVSALPEGKRRVIRLVGIAPETAFAWSAYVPGAPATLGAGQVAEVETDAAVGLTATQPVLVAEYMEGNTRGGDEGDPSLAVAVPTSRFRTSHALAIPDLGSGTVDLVAPLGAEVRVNAGEPLELVPISGTGHGYVRVGAGAGQYTFTGDRPFGASAYATSEAASWWFTPAFGP